MQSMTSQTLLYTRLKQPSELITFGIDVECIEFLFHLAGDSAKESCQHTEREGDWRQRMSYAVDFVQAETQLFSGGPCHALWCEPEH